MDAFEMYGRFLAMQRHFTTDYDGFKYNFKMRTNHEKFMERNDRYMFHKLSRHDDPDNLMIANFLSREKVWVTDLFDSRAEMLYNDLKRRQGTMSYVIKNELSSFDDFNESLAVKDGQFPPLLRGYMGKKVSPETMLAVNELTGVFSHWDKKIEDDLIWPSIHKKLMKYRPFIQLKREALRKVVVDIFSQK